MSVIQASQLFHRARMWLAGVTHNGARDLYETFGYKRNPDYRDFVAKYRRQGIAKRIVNAPVLATWCDPPQLVSSDPVFNEKWQLIVQTQRLFHNIIRLDKLAGLGSYAVMVVGYDDSRPMSSPVKASPDRQVIYLQPYHEGAAQIMEYETDNTNPRFGLPTKYRINPGRFNMVDGSSTPRVGLNAMDVRQPFDCHHTRLVHVAENLLEDSLFGTSRLECVNNDLDDILKISGGSAELFWLLGNRGMQVDIDPEMDVSPETAADLEKEISEYQHQLRRFIRTRGVKIQNLGSDPANPEPTYNVSIKQIAAATGIPQALMMGSSLGHLASQSDRAAWAERCAERIAEYNQPVILKGILDCFINAGALPIPQDLQIHWPEAFKLSPLERAQTSAQMARSAANLTKAHGNMAGDANQNGVPDNQEKGNNNNNTTDGQDGQKPQGNDPTKRDQPQKSAQPLFSTEEMRRMVSFGKHPPVFDNPQPSGEVSSTGQAPASATNVPKPTTSTPTKAK